MGDEITITMGRGFEKIIIFILELCCWEIMEKLYILMFISFGKTIGANCKKQVALGFWVPFV